MKARGKKKRFLIFVVFLRHRIKCLDELTQNSAKSKICIDFGMNQCHLSVRESDITTSGDAVTSGNVFVREIDAAVFLLGENCFSGSDEEEERSSDADYADFGSSSCRNEETPDGTT